MQLQLILVLVCASRQTLTKSIQNTTSSDEELIQSRLDLLETKIASIENTSKLYNYYNSYCMN